MEDQPTQNLVEDIDLAHDMANASDVPRSMAAKQRAAMLLEDPYSDGFSEAENALDKEKSDASHQKTAAFYDEVAEAREADVLARSQSSDVDEEVPKTERLSRTPDDYVEDIDKSREMAYASKEKREEVARGDGWSDEEANQEEINKLEEWAGVLHETPPSDAFKRRFGLSEITPELLANIDHALNSEFEYHDPYDDNEVADTIRGTVDSLMKTFLDDIRSGRANRWEDIG